MEENLYIKALSYGSERIEKGVSFNELIEFLSKHLVAEFGTAEGKEEFKKSFNVWFYDNFYLREVQKKRNGIYTIPDFALMNMNNDKKARLKGEAYFKLIEYKELKESRSSSRKAFYIAAFAAILTFASVFYQIFGDSLICCVSE